jgi:hypothetical protein
MSSVANQTPNSASIRNRPRDARFTTTTATAVIGLIPRKGKKGPGLKGIFQHQYLSLSGLPANDERVSDIIRNGRPDMPGYSQTLSAARYSGFARVPAHAVMGES